MIHEDSLGECFGVVRYAEAHPDRIAEETSRRLERDMSAFSDPIDDQVVKDGREALAKYAE